MSLRRRETPPRHQAGSLLGEAVGFKPGFALEPVGVAVGLQGYFTVEIRYGDIKADKDQDFLTRRKIAGNSVKIAVTSIQNDGDRENVAKMAAKGVRAAVNELDTDRLGDLEPYLWYFCSNPVSSRYVVVMLDKGGRTDLGGSFPSTTLAKAAMGNAVGVPFAIAGDSEPRKRYTWAEGSSSPGTVALNVTPM